MVTVLASLGANSSACQLSRSFHALKQAAASSVGIWWPVVVSRKGSSGPLQAFNIANACREIDSYYSGTMTIACICQVVPVASGFDQLWLQAATISRMPTKLLNAQTSIIVAGFTAHAALHASRCNTTHPHSTPAVLC